MGALSQAPIEIEVQVAPAPDPIEETQKPLEKPALTRKLESAPRAHAAADHRHSYPVPESHDGHPHDPSIVHSLERHRPSLPGAPAPRVVAVGDETPLRFVLPAHEGLVSRGGGAVVSRPADLEGESSAVTWPESGVDAQARLVASVPVIYPEDARRGEIEADVLVEIVVDSEGRVASARSLTPQRQGLEEAALSAVRHYRFAPARRGGRPVRVRMQWSVAFRLR